MNAQQLAAGLRTLDPLLQVLLGRGELQSVRRFADAVEAGGKKSVTAVVAKIGKQIGHKGDGATSSIAAPFNTLANALSATGASGVAKEFALVASLLNKMSGLDAEGVFAVVSGALAPPDKKTRLKRLPVPAIDARATADRLLAATSDNDAFDKLLDELSVHSKPTLEDIAKRYLGYERAFRSKADVIKSIRSRQLQDAIQESKDRRISKIAV
ncbi:MAG: hypothetical protein AB7E81_06645 [Hyphomicrobiaceae bacterium]